MVQYGYRTTTEVLPPLPEKIRPGSSITSRKDVDIKYRPVSAALPLFVRGVLLPKPDLNHGPSIVAGFQKRVVNPVPKEFSTARLAKFMAFVDRWLQNNLEPLPADTDISVEGWLEDANYPAWRKEELAALDPDEVANWPAHIKAKSFIKDEFYAEFKYPRTINPRDDYFKVFSGPIVHRIEQQVFKLPYFIKKVPMEKRGAYIMDKVFAPDARYMLTDYTSFESSFLPEVMRACEMRLFKWMTHRLPCGSYWYASIERAATGVQTLVAKTVTTTTEGGRLSGDMWTSLCNGFTNLMNALFAGEELQLGELFGVFEGDDGLCRYSSGQFPNSEFFKELGFTVKMDIVDEIGKASFCGMVFEPHSCQQMTDPRPVLASFGWTSARYLGSKRSKLLGLLRSKALSLAFERPGCPVLSALAHRVIYLTRGIDCRWVAKSRNTTHWLRERIEYVTTHVAPCETPTMATRELFAELYDIPVEQQLSLEASISMMEIGPVDVPLEFPRLWHDVWERYVVEKPPQVNDPWHVAAQCERKAPEVIRLRGSEVLKGALNPYRED